MDKFVCQLSTVLVLIGALNWGLVGAANWNAVTKTVDLLNAEQKTRETIEKAVYVLVGLAALFLIWKKLSSKHV
jgi:uncharacterized membrane protein YuzA (DUF378 family)